MRITKSKIKSLIRQVLLEKIDLPHPDEIQRDVYNQIIAGKSIEEIFPNHDREALKDKIKLLYRYIKEEELPVPEYIGSSWSKRFMDESVSYEDFLKTFNDFIVDANNTPLPEREQLSTSASIFHNVNKELFSQGSEGAQARQEANFGIIPPEFNEKVQTAVRIQIQRIMSQLGNRNSMLSRDLIERHRKYVDGEHDLSEVVTGLQEELQAKAKKKIENTDDYFANLGAFTVFQMITGSPAYDFFGFVSLRRRLDNLQDDIKEKKTAERVISQRKVMTRLKDLTTTQIEDDTANWFAVHYVGAFAGSNETYIGRLASFLKAFGGPGGISSDEFAAVPYPKSAKKLNDSLATGKSSQPGEEFHKIGMVLNGTITSIFSDDVHSDTFSSARQRRGLGGEYNPEEGFVRFPGGEKSDRQTDAAGEFMKFDKPILDLASAEEEIANSDVYPGSRGYYECFIDDWYAEGIACNWNEFERKFNPDPFIFGKKGVDDIIEFLKVIKDKKIKIYDENFDDKRMSYDRLCDMFSFILAKSGIMEFKENPDGSLTGPLDYLKLPMSKPKLPIGDK